MQAVLERLSYIRGLLRKCRDGKLDPLTFANQILVDYDALCGEYISLLEELSKSREEFVAAQKETIEILTQLKKEREEYIQVLTKYNDLMERYYTCSKN